jgi:hypothetical protein
MGFHHAGLFVCVPGRRCVQPVIRPCTVGVTYSLRTAAPYGPHEEAAFHAASLHGDLHLLRKI